MLLPDACDIRLLTQVGFLAASRGDVPRALRIFNALALLRPDQAFSFVGMACALMNAARAADAVQRLQAICLPPGPESDMLRAFQGLALQLDGRAGESTYVLRQIVSRIDKGTPSEGARLAASLLGEDLDMVPMPQPMPAPSF